MRVLKLKLSKEKSTLNRLKNKARVIESVLKQITQIISEFYSGLYNSTTLRGNKYQIDNSKIL